MKKIISTLLSLALVIGICPILASADEVATWDGTAAESFAEGSGTEADPYKIYTAAELKLASDTVNSAPRNEVLYYFSLQNDIDYQNQAWVPIGKSNSNGNTGFYGGFEGNGHIIKNLVIGSEGYYYCGFFGLVHGATISNLGIENFQLVHKNTSTAKNTTIGGFAGQARDTTKITNCYIKNSSIHQTSKWSSGESTLAGFLGQADVRSSSIELTNCYVYNVSLHTQTQGRACAFFGGLSFQTASDATNIKFTNCYVANVTNANTEATQYGFGFVGANNLKFAVNNGCYSTFESIEGTYPAQNDTNKAQLVDDSYFGAEGQTVDEIKTAFAHFDSWKDGTYINGGFPALAWEKAPIEVTNFADGTVTIEINKATNNANVYVATYDGSGRLVSADVQPLAETVNANVTTAGAAYVRVFVWDANLSPVATSFGKAL